MKLSLATLTIFAAALAMEDCTYIDSCSNDALLEQLNKDQQAACEECGDPYGCDGTAETGEEVEVTSFYCYEERDAISTQFSVCLPAVNMDEFVLSIWGVDKWTGRDDCNKLEGIDLELSTHAHNMPIDAKGNWPAVRQAYLCLNDLEPEVGYGSTGVWMSHTPATPGHPWSLPSRFGASVSEPEGPASGILFYGDGLGEITVECNDYGNAQGYHPPGVGCRLPCDLDEECTGSTIGEVVCDEHELACLPNP